MMSKESMDVLLVSCGLAIMVGYHHLLLYRILLHPHTTTIGYENHNKLAWVQGMAQVLVVDQSRFFFFSFCMAVIAASCGTDRLFDHAGDGAGGDGLGAERHLRWHLGVHDAGVAVHRAGLADRRVGEQRQRAGDGGAHHDDGGGREVHVADRLLSGLLHLLHPVRGALRARELPDERAAGGAGRAAGEPRAARGDSGRQLLGAGAPGALLRHDAAHVGPRPRAHARLLRAHRRRAVPARRQLHAAAPAPPPAPVHGQIDVSEPAR